MKGFGNEIAKGYGKILVGLVIIGTMLFMLGLLIGFMLGGDSEKLKPVAEWDGPVGIEMRTALAIQKSNEITEQLIAELRKCYPEAK